MNNLRLLSLFLFIVLELPLRNESIQNDSPEIEPIKDVLIEDFTFVKSEHPDSLESLYIVSSGQYLEEDEENCCEG